MASFRWIDRLSIVSGNMLFVVRTMNSLGKKDCYLAISCNILIKHGHLVISDKIPTKDGYLVRSDKTNGYLVRFLLVQSGSAAPSLVLFSVFISINALEA